MAFPGSRAGSRLAGRVRAAPFPLARPTWPTSVERPDPERNVGLAYDHSWSRRYPVRLALNPLISTIGWYLPQLFSGSLIVATVMNLPNIGPLLLRALINQDMYLAGGILLIYSFLTIVGTLLSDIALAMMDPRIRMET